LLPSIARGDDDDQRRTGASAFGAESGALRREVEDAARAARLREGSILHDDEERSSELECVSRLVV
jgi:hypothetical protein